MLSKWINIYQSKNYYFSLDENQQHFKKVREQIEKYVCCSLFFMKMLVVRSVGCVCAFV